MRIRYWFLGILSVFYWGAGVWSVVTYFSISHDVVFLSIQAAQLARLSHPVFAQFTATQTLHWDKPIAATRLEIPLYLPNNTEGIFIKLYDDKKLITWWRYAPPAHDNGVFMAELPFIVPTNLSGNIEVELDGSSIPYADSDRAPAFFAEPQDGAYPEGNYRIANNEKAGDIAMSIIVQKTNLQLFIDKFYQQPLGSISALFIYACAALLMFYVPVIGMRIGEGLLSKTQR